MQTNCICPVLKLYCWLDFSLHLINEERRSKEETGMHMGTWQYTSHFLFWRRLLLIATQVQKQVPNVQHVFKCNTDLKQDASYFPTANSSNLTIVNDNAADEAQESTISLTSPQWKPGHTTMYSLLVWVFLPKFHGHLAEPVSHKVRFILPLVQWAPMCGVEAVVPCPQTSLEGHHIQFIGVTSWYLQCTKQHIVLWQGREVASESTFLWKF